MEWRIPPCAIVTLASQSAVRLVSGASGSGTETSVRGSQGVIEEYFVVKERHGQTESVGFGSRREVQCGLRGCW